MPTAGQSIADEIEAAIGGGSTAKCIETAKRVTDLFLVTAGQFNGEQIALFDNVLERLIKAIEQRAIADIAADELITGVSFEAVEVIEIAGIGELVEVDDAVAGTGCENEPDEIRAYEACTACYEEPHCFPSMIDRRL